MFVIFAVILSGILTGRLFANRRLAFVSPLITSIIWVLLFLLGAEVGADPAVVGGMATLGVTAFVIFAFSAAGSIAAAWLLDRKIRRGAAPASSGASMPADVEAEVAATAAATNGTAADTALFPNPAEQTGPAVPSDTAGSADSAACEAFSSAGPAVSSGLWDSLKGSLVIVAFFAVGCVSGLLIPLDAAELGVSTWVLYALMFCVGVSLGHDRTLAARVRRLDPRLALLPVATIAGTLAGAALAAPLIAPWSAADSLAVGAGFGYYSLSSIFIADLKGPELATIALLCNIMREIFTLLCAPLVARWAGPLAAVSIGGATTFDTTLPIITRAAGKPYAVVAIFHGCVMDFSVPFLVTLFCRL